MTNLHNQLVIKSNGDRNVARHFHAIQKEHHTDQDGRAYCICGHQPTVVPIDRVVDGKKSKRFVAMCNTCMPGGAVHLREHEASDQAITDFDLNCRLTPEGGELYADQDDREYCKCGHQPTVVPIDRVIDGMKSKRFVAMCNTCMPGGAMHLREYKAPYLAITDFDLNCRLTRDVGGCRAI